ncbi:MAG: hypothetical protein M1821_002024 [Bathelium mastoideum]|nr:MAG: hypothetical protein M1821_002024 [Bathelium mastoideum]
MPSPFALLIHYRYLLAFLLFLTLVEIAFHIHSLAVPRPTHPLDPPFASHCHIPPSAPFAHDPSTAPADAALSPRENATLLMLARNSDLDGAVRAVRSLEARFNRWFQYPIVFLNDQQWSAEFVAALRAEASGETVFATIPEEMWGWPRDGEGRETVDRKRFAAEMGRLAKAGLPYVESESYHHMCRFYSGYGRLFLVAITVCRRMGLLDQLRTNNKTYGYTIALWEIGSTAPSLFRTVASHKSSHAIPSSPLWTSMLDASWAPLPLRWGLMSDARLFHSRTSLGDAWNFCHFWSNFEIADLDFFRSKEYQRLFADLDAAGGFYYERWGDAPVHSLATALFLQPEQLHWFEDIGYMHPPFQHCPREGVGCGCECDQEASVKDTCLRLLRRAVEP